MRDWFLFDHFHIDSFDSLLKEKFFNVEGFFFQQFKFTYCNYDYHNRLTAFGIANESFNGKFIFESILQAKENMNWRKHFYISFTG